MVAILKFTVDGWRKTSLTGLPWRRFNRAIHVDYCTIIGENSLLYRSFPVFSSINKRRGLLTGGWRRHGGTPER
jgi:hypothetical protein